jgi:hypothetical protein
MFYCQEFILTPYLLANESWEVYYKLVSSTVWVSYLPNPTSNNFTICGLSEGLYDYKIRRVKADGSKCAFGLGEFTIAAPIGGCVDGARITEDGNCRILENGDFRIIE